MQLWPPYPEPVCKNMPMIIDEARKRCPVNHANVVFNVDGLAYSERMMQAQRRKFGNKKTRDVAKMALLADVVTTAFPDWVGEEGLEAYLNTQNPTTLNTTAIANAAHISLYATSPELRKKYTDVVAKLY